jgi:60 kDa SS-A/Ro ribonucleoprotein
MNKSVKLRDALFLTHPKAIDKSMQEIFDKIASETLEVPYTWEVELTRAGQTGRSKKVVWEELIDSGKVGFMALLRNVRNFLQEGISKEHIVKVCNIIADPEQVAKSKQLPFRFMSAYRSILSGSDQGGFRTYNAWVLPEEFVGNPNVERVMNAIEVATKYSVRNMPVFNGEDVLIATDVSGSMFENITPKSTVTQFDIGALMAMVAKYACENSIVGMFGDSWKVLDVKRDDGILSNVNILHNREGEVGYSTNGYKVLEWANQQKHIFDRIMMFTDCQMYNSNRWGNTKTVSDIDRQWNLYRANKNPNCKLYLFDLSGYGASPIEIKDNGVYTIAGFSDKVFDVITRLEQGQSAIDEIMSVIL